MATPQLVKVAMPSMTRVKVKVKVRTVLKVLKALKARATGVTNPSEEGSETSRMEKWQAGGIQGEV